MTGPRAELLAPSDDRLVFSGVSMLPTLREPAMLDLEPVTLESVRPGDVLAYFDPPRDRRIIHRALELVPGGWRVRGDNNTTDDGFLVTADLLVGRVVGASVGRRHWRVTGGTLGLVLHRALRLRRLALRCLRPLGGTWRAAARWVACHLPERWRPRVIVYAGGRAQAVLGRLVLARRARDGEPWRVSGWRRFLVDVESLP